MNFELIAYRPVSGHPDDYYLSIVLRKMPNKIHPYVTHLHNENDNGYSAGHYFEHLGEALTDFCTR